MSDGPQQDKPAATESSDATTIAHVPTARLQRRRRMSSLWLAPVLMFILAVWLAFQAWGQRGLEITIELDAGHGLKPGDEIRYQGTTVGEVVRVKLDESMEHVLVTGRLNTDASQLARGGSRFWVVRPQVGLMGIAGLETVLGPRYLAVLPGDGGEQTDFIGLPDEPVVPSMDPGDLEVIVHGPRRGSLRRGAPVIYRNVRVGTILSVGLASDASAVEARLHIQKAYTPLIRQRTRFWDAGGLHADVGLGGLSIDIESVDTLVTGGIALATPPDGGDIVRTGHRFRIEANPKDEWRKWQPLVAIGSSLLPAGAQLPSPLRAKVGWESGGLISRDRSIQGWVLQTNRGLLGPSDLLSVDEEDERENAVLEVAGTVVPLDESPRALGEQVALLTGQVAQPVWPAARIRAPGEVEDCIVIADPTEQPIPLAAVHLSHLGAGDGEWTIDAALSFEASWHGACVLARSDGFLIGVLLVDEDIATVATITEPIEADARARSKR